MATSIDTAKAEPVHRVKAPFIGALALASLGMWTALYTPIQVLLARQLEVIDPATKESALGLVTGLGALVALVANPVIGALSDRTTSRFGRRRPWLAGGAVAAAAGLIALTAQGTVLGVAVVWCLVQLALVAVLAALVAEVPDRVPVEQRAVVSAWTGVTQPLAVLAGTALVTAFSGGYPLIAGVLVLLVLPFLLSVKDERISSDEVPRWRFLASFWVSPRRYPDFALAWITRFLIQLGNAISTLFLLYFLRDSIRYEEIFPGRKAEQGLLLLVLLYSSGIVLTAFAGGVLSDRLGRRKTLITVAGVVIALGSSISAAWQSWPAVVVSACLLGLGYGAYVSVDQALITQVLPDPADRGKDLGLINVANSLPHVLGPALAALLVTELGGYRALFGVSAALTLCGAILVQRIRSVR